jgi:hypothetical protein
MIDLEELEEALAEDEPEIVEDSPELGLAIISLLTMVALWVDHFGGVYYLYGC